MILYHSKVILFMKNWDNKDSKDLFKIIARIKNENEARGFLRDLLTEAEIIEFSKRWKVAKMLNYQIPYTTICNSTGLSSRTVARISKWLNSGMGGYKRMIKANTDHRGSQSFGKGLS